MRRSLQHHEIFSNDQFWTNMRYWSEITFKLNPWDELETEKLILCRKQINRLTIKGSNWPSFKERVMFKNLYGMRDYMYCQYCLTPRFNLVAISLEASETTILISPLSRFNLYRLQLHFTQRFG